MSRQTVLEALRDLPFAPSVGSHAVPRKTVAQEIGLTRDNGVEEDELDVQIRRASFCYVNVRQFFTLNMI
jgi:hypothetical protein